MKFPYHDPTAFFFEKRDANGAASHPAQQVLGLQVAYPLQLRANAERARRVGAALPAEIAPHLDSLEVFDARGIVLITDFSVYRYVFREGAPLTLDEMAEGSAEHLVCLEGVRNPKCVVRTLAVSNLDARQISFSADRWNQKFGVEQLGILEPGTRTLWAVQATYKKSPPLRMLTAFALFRTRRRARRILGSIRLATR
jgi:hypothetical protein